MIDCVLLGSGKCYKGQDMHSLYLQLACGRTCPPIRIVRNIMIKLGELS